MNIGALPPPACALLMTLHPMVASFDTDVRGSSYSEPTSGPRPAVLCDLRPGRRVSGSIELVRPIATGGMGHVWLAQHWGLDIPVAVKFMRREVAEDPVSVSRFEQEAKLAARIKSPHVVEVFDYDVTDTGVPFIVMESLRGRDLETVLENGRTLGISDAARVLVQVCKALSKAHALGVIHRDIKAENVFVVQEDGVPLIKVLDFGVAKETSTENCITLSGTTVGTPAYMSPEQLFHPKEIDLRTDLWATAVLTYRCLTGAFPFEGESFGSVCLSVSKGKFAPPSARNSGLPAGLDAWFKKAFHKSLDSRFSSAAEMSEAFLSELRKADLVPEWAEAGSTAVTSSATLSQASSGMLFQPRTPRRPRSLRRTAVMQVGAALAAFLLFEVAPPPIHAAVVDFAGQAIERTHVWAVSQGLYPPSLGSIADTWSPPSTNGMADVTWLPPPSANAVAEPEVALLEGAGHAAAVRNDRISRHTSISRAPRLEFDPFAAPSSTPTAALPAEAVSTASSPKVAPAAPSVTELATVRFGL